MPINAFILSDNIEIFKSIHKILLSKNLNISYFCHKDSTIKFKGIVDIKPKDLKLDYKDLLSYDIGFSIHSKQIFPKELVEKVLCINLHPGFNPYNKGIFPQSFSIINKLPIGATLHIMDSDIDSGAIIAQTRLDIRQSDTSLSLYKRILKAEIDIFRDNIDAILSGEFKASKPLDSGNYNSKADFSAMCKIDLDKVLSMREAIDYLRALSHPPYKNAYFINEYGERQYLRLQLLKNASMGGGRGLNLKLCHSLDFTHITLHPRLNLAISCNDRLDWIAA